MDAMLLVKVTLVLALTLGVSRLVRRAAAVARHRLWTVAFVSLVALPWLAFALPALYVPVPEGWSTRTANRPQVQVASEKGDGNLFRGWQSKKIPVPFSRPNPSQSLHNSGLVCRQDRSC